MNGERITEPVDLPALACRFFKLTVYYVRFANEDTEPMGYISNGHVGIDIVYENQRINYVFPKNTILLDIRLKKDMVKLREVLSHELLHYIDSIVNAYPIEILMMNDGSMEYGKYMEMMKKREWRADEGSAVLLLPKELVTKVYREQVGYINIKVYGDSFFISEDKFRIAAMAKQLKVSFDMLVKRLNDLDLFERHNVGEFLQLAFGNGDTAV